MKNSYFIQSLIGLASLLSITACAEKDEIGDNSKNIRFIEKWIEVFNKRQQEEDPDFKEVQASGRGIYILHEEINPEGVEYQKDNYIVTDYETRDLKGNITATSDKELARKLNFPVSNSIYYGPKIMNTLVQTTYAGFLDGLQGIRKGSDRDFLIPSWLMTVKQYGSAEEYRQHKTDQSDVIYSLHIRDIVKDVNEYQLKIMEEKLSAYGLEAKDTIRKGIFYKSLEVIPAPEKPEKPEKPGNQEKAEDKDKVEDVLDSTRMDINYTGTMLFRDYTTAAEKVSTRIFDTSIEKTAKDAGIWNAAAKYTPKEIKFGTKAEETTMGTSTVIRGFYETLWQMRKERATKAIAIFWSDLGYGTKGSGQSIPGYTPLVFEIERIVQKPAEK